MSARSVVLYPDPRLKVICDPVTEVDEALRAAAQDLLDTMDAGPPRTVASPPRRLACCRGLRL